MQRPITKAAAAAAVLVMAAGAGDAGAGERRCRGGKQFYAGECRYPEEIKSLKAQQAREAAAAERRRRERAARQEAEEKARRDAEACDQARAADTLEAWQAYSAEFPDGQCDAEAMGRITLLQRAEPPEPPPPPPPEPDDEEPEGGLSPLVYVGFGIGAAGFVTWGIAGGVSFAKRSTLSDECPDDVCTPEQQDTIDSGELAGHVATVGMVVGFAGAALGVVGLLLPTGDDDGSDDEQAFVRPFVGPGQLGLTGRF